MVRINDGLTTASQKESYTQTTSINKIDNVGTEALSNIQKSSNLLIQETQRLRDNAVREQLRKEEIDYQTNALIPKLQADMQQESLKTLYTLTAIDEANRQEQENALANAYILKATSDAELAFDTNYQNILSSSGKYGEGLIENTQKYLNQNLLDIEKNAPNGKAIEKLQIWASNFKTKSLGKAVEDKNTIRNYSIIENVSGTVNNLSNILLTNPNDTRQLGIEELISETIKTTSLDPIKKEEAIKNLSKNITLSKIQGFANIGDFESSNRFLLENANKLNNQEYQKVLKQNFQAEKEMQNLKVDLGIKQQAQQKFFEGSLSYRDLENPKISKAIDEVFLTQATIAEQEFLNRGDIKGYVNSLTQTIKSSKLPIKAYKSYFEDISQGSNPARSVAAAQVFKNINEDVSALGVFSEIDKNTKVKLELINRLSPYSDPENTIKKVNLVLDKTTQKGEALEESWKALVTSKDSTIERSAKSVLRGANLMAWYNGAPQNTSEIELDYKESLYNYFKISNGNLEVAEKLALKEISDSYRISEINGTKEAVRYPVEYFYQGEDSELFLNNITDQAKKSNRKFDSKDLTLDNIPVKILPIEGVTGNQINNNYTSWQLVVNKEGAYPEVLARVDVPLNLKESRADWYKNWVDSGRLIEKKLEKEYGKLAKFGYETLTQSETTNLTRKQEADKTLSSIGK